MTIQFKSLEACFPQILASSSLKGPTGQTPIITVITERKQKSELKKQKIFLMMQR